MTQEGTQRCAPEQLSTVLTRADGFVWVDLPVADPDTERVLSDVFGFHPRAVRDGLERNPIPKVHVYADHVLVVLHAPETGHGGHVHYLELDQFVGSRYLVTVHGPLNPAVDPAAASERPAQVAARLDAGRLGPASPYALSTSIVSALTSRMRDHLAERTTDVWRFEQQVTAGQLGDAEQFLDGMFRVRHGLLAVRTMASLSHEIYGRMYALDAYGEDGRALLDNSLDQFQRLATMARSQEEYLQGVIEFYQTRTNTKMTIAAERLAVIAVGHAADHRAVVGDGDERHRQLGQRPGDHRRSRQRHGDDVRDPAGLGQASRLVVSGLLHAGAALGPQEARDVDASTSALGGRCRAFDRLLHGCRLRGDRLRLGGQVPSCPAAGGCGDVRSASVSNATSASSCTSADDATSSSEPSSARAASPALLSISSAIRASMVCAAMMRHAVTGSVWPMRWLRSMAWVCSASVQDSSASTMFEATCRFRPTPAAVREQTAMATSGSFTNASMFFCRAVGRLVTADRREAHALPGEGLLGGVHHVDVLGEEDDLARAAGQLRRVVGGEAGLRLADAPHHG